MAAITCLFHCSLANKHPSQSFLCHRYLLLFFTGVFVGSLLMAILKPSSCDKVSPNMQPIPYQFLFPDLTIKLSLYPFLSLSLSFCVCMCGCGYVYLGTFVDISWICSHVSQSPCPIHHPETFVAEWPPRTSSVSVLHTSCSGDATGGEATIYTKWKTLG